MQNANDDENSKKPMMINHEFISKIMWTCLEKYLLKHDSCHELYMMRASNAIGSLTQDVSVNDVRKTPKAPQKSKKFD